MTNEIKDWKNEPFIEKMNMINLFRNYDGYGMKSARLNT